MNSEIVSDSHQLISFTLIKEPCNSSLSECYLEYELIHLPLSSMFCLILLWWWPEKTNTVNCFVNIVTRQDATEQKN